jgi:hypothetical protein
MELTLLRKPRSKSIPFRNIWQLLRIDKNVMLIREESLLSSGWVIMYTLRCHL